MTKYIKNATLNLPISKGRYYGVYVDFPTSWKNFTFTSYLRIGSVFTEMDMNILSESTEYIRYKIELSAAKTAILKGSGDCEIQVAVVDSVGDVYDVLVLETFLESNKNNIQGANNE